MLQNKVKAALKTLENGGARADIARWLTTGERTDIQPGDMPLILAEFRLLDTPAALEAQEHYFVHHDFMVVSTDGAYLGFYRDATGKPCVCMVKLRKDTGDD